MPLSFPNVARREFWRGVIPKSTLEKRQLFLPNTLKTCLSFSRVLIKPYKSFICRVVERQLFTEVLIVDATILNFFLGGGGGGGGRGIPHSVTIFETE